MKPSKTQWFWRSLLRDLLSQGLLSPKGRCWHTAFYIAMKYQGEVIFLSCIFQPRTKMDKRIHRILQLFEVTVETSFCMSSEWQHLKLSELCKLSPLQVRGVRSLLPSSGSTSQPQLYSGHQPYCPALLVRPQWDSASREREWKESEMKERGRSREGRGEVWMYKGVANLRWPPTGSNKI